MNNALPQKVQKMLEQVTQIIQPAAIKAAGPVLVDLKRANDDNAPDKRAIFVQHFRNGMASLFQQMLEKPDPKEAAQQKKRATKEEMEERISKYSLMDTELLEAQLMADRLCKNLEQDNQFDIDSLGMRLEKFCGITFEREKNPIQARHLTLVFRQSCDALSPSKHSGDVAIENWGKVLKQAYPQLLQHLNQSLIKQHILPRLDLDDIDQRYQKKGQDKAREMRKNLIADITGKPQDANAEVSDDDLMQSIKALVNDAALQRPDINRHLVSGSNHGPVASKDEVLSTLRQITQSPVINAETGYRELDANEKTLAEKIQTLTNLQSRALDDQTQNSISLLSMMFDRLQQEEQIADPIKPLINELQLPILKMAVTNQDFFSNSDNPAQELVNEIAKAGTHWTPKQNISKDPFYKKISSIVDDISISSESDENNEFIFDEKLLSLKDFLEKEERRSALLEERIIQAESVKARTESARRSAETIIKKRIEKHNAKPHTATFLHDYWTQVLFFYINQDDEFNSPEQEQALELMKTLLVATPQNIDTDIDHIFEQLVTHLHHMRLEVANSPQTFSSIRKEIGELRNQARAEIEAAEAERAAAAAALAEAQAAEAREAARLKAAAEQAAAEQAAAEQAALRLQAAAEKAAAEQAAAARAAAAMQEAAEKAAAEQAAAKLKAAAEQAAAEQRAAQQAAARMQAAAEQAAAEQAAAKKAAAEQAAARLRAAEEQAAREALEAANDLELIAEEPSTDSVEDIFDQQVGKLRAESWFKLTNENHDKTKIKLAAIIKHNGNYIFVNREGVKVITTQKSGVAALLRSRELEIVDDAVFFDRALESVIQSLRK
ncbi:MAG TPA: DUF1631 family protein [Pseudomonadales bacterium]|nr:DUF1631 family protein [Pseudomonadales bacterium]